MYALIFLVLVVFPAWVTSQSPFGQLLLAYYSGVGMDSVGPGGVNALSLAFFAPAAMTGSSCDFSDLQTSCVRPAAGAGPSLGLSWALSTINLTSGGLSGNTSPSRGRKPTIFFAFGGQSEGGGAWDQIFGNSNSATVFGQNCAKMVQAVYTRINKSVFIGIDLDIEGMSTTLPQFPAFIKSFRNSAPANEFPLMLDSLSGLANDGSSDHYKVAIMQDYGPASGGINFLNMMVNNVQSSCDTMSGFWRDSRLNFIPPANKVLGFWGENLAAWILKNPGCTDGSNPLYPWMKQNGVGIGIWQWWLGSTSNITPVINQIRG